MNLELDIAKCVTCEEVFRPSHSPQKIQNILNTKKVEKPLELNVRLEEDHGSLKITLPPFGFVRPILHPAVCYFILEWHSGQRVWRRLDEWRAWVP